MRLGKMLLLGEGSFLSATTAVSKAVMDPSEFRPSAVGRAASLVFFVAALPAALLLFAPGATPARAARARHAMVVAESDQAARAGLEILRHGGNAIDAACAASLVTGVTNPGSCGVGGGGFMLIYLARTATFYALDYRERAPMAASGAMYLRNGRVDETLARTGPLAVAVPGEIAGIEAALKQFGTMKFQDVAARAIELARQGVPLSERLARQIGAAAPTIAKDPGLTAMFLRDGKAPKSGTIMVNRNLAATLTQLGSEPAKNFYHGPVAARIARFMKDHGGLITERDLADYRPLWRKPLNRLYHGYDVYTMPPPSSGGVMLEMLGMLERGRLAGLGLDSPPYLARIIEVMRQGFIDRARYADPDFVPVPIAELLSQRHIELARERALHRAGPKRNAEQARDHGTASVCVIDEAGNAVVINTTINTIFGAKLMIPDLGIILNNEMDDFSLGPGVPNAFKLIQSKENEVAPGKRPLSSMSPIIAMRSGRPALLAGGSGGPAIITALMQMMLDIVDFHRTPEQAEQVPRIHEQAEPDIVFIEPKLPEPTRNALGQMGYNTKVFDAIGAVGAISISPGKIRAAYDPRKGGGAYGY